MGDHATGRAQRSYRLHLCVPGIAFILGVAAAAPAQTLDFARTDVASAAGARAIVSADFDRDGKPDLAHANVGANPVTVLLNRGDHFSAAVNVPVGAGPFDLAAGDFNRDGIADLAVANADGDSISVLIGRGDGTFTRSDIAAPSQNP